MEKRNFNNKQEIKKSNFEDRNKRNSSKSNQNKTTIFHINKYFAWKKGI